MSVTAIILLTTALLTVVAVVILLWSVVRRTSAVAQDLAAFQERIGPELDRLRRDAEISSLEVQRVSESIERLQASREKAGGRGVSAGARRAAR